MTGFFEEDGLPYDEALAFRFLNGDYRDAVGGFPSVAFHDGYRDYNERITSWIENSPRLDGDRSSEKIREWLADYAAGALARSLEEDGWPWKAPRPFR